MKIQWVTAVFLALALILWGILSGLGKTDAAGFVAVLGMVVHACLPALFKLLDGNPPSDGSIDAKIPAPPPTKPEGLSNLMLAFACMLLWGCGPSATTTAAHVKNAGDAAAFGVELTACRDKATHPAQADYDACAKALDVKYGRTGT